ncbi:MAG: pyruvate dehydrogenase complex dihydrolipoamide acetyltransferase [Pyrinomonadaceae bacterium]|nr:pyruvate dehydrogenase complex dihydrolipoamide acetyltransferase [Pyrinomonadaceae bacterium]
MPKLSPTMEEGQISRWLKAEGDEIEANETIAEVDTDKATMEMTSLEAGTLLKIIVPGGENAKLGQTIGILGKKGEDFSALLDEATASNGSKSEPPAVADGSKTEESAPKETPKAETAETGGRSYDEQRPEAKADAKDQKPKTEDQPSNGRMIVSPIAARMAAENGIDLKTLKGSGPGGRIIKRDIEEAMAGGKVEVIEEISASPKSEIQNPKLEGASAYREENTSRMRQVIASRLAESIGPIPTFYLTVEIEMDAALEFRKQINASIPEADKVSVNDIIVKVTAQALTKHAWANASYQDKTIRFYEDADIGVAVAIEDGLITPVIRAANRKGIVEISKEIKEKAVRAREKKLQPEEYTGATFSISNLGMFGIKEFTAIINPPEAGIFAVGAATPTPVVRNGEIVVRQIMNVTMSCDHRVIDGATGAKFLQTFKQMLENPILMLM